MNTLYRFSLTFGLRVFNAAGQIALSLVIFKVYGTEALGLFTIFLSNTMLATLLARQGFDRTLILFRIKKRLSKYSEQLFFNYSRRILMIAPLIGAINVAIYYLSVGEHPNPLLFFILLLLPGVIALSFVAAGYFTGVGKTIAASVQQPGFSAGWTVIALSLLYHYGIEVDVFALFFLFNVIVSANGFTRIISASSEGWHGLFSTGLRDTPRIRKISARLSRQYLVINFFTTFSSVYFFSFLAFFVSPDEIGTFRAIERIAQLIAFNLSFINIIMPGSTLKAYNAKERVWFNRAIKNTFLFQYVTGIGVFGVIVLFSDRIMTWLDVESISLFLLPLCAQLINTLSGPVRVVLMYLGGQRVLQVSVILETFGAMALYFLFYRLYGIEGLAVGYFVTIATPNVLLALIVFKRYGIVPFPFVDPRYRKVNAVANGG